MSASPAAVRDFGVGIGLGAVATVVVGLRFLAKRLVTVPDAFADDYWVLGGLVFMYGFLASAGVCMCHPKFDRKAILTSFSGLQW